MKHVFFIVLTTLFSAFFLFQSVPAVQAAGCEQVGQCVDNKVCECFNCDTPAETLYAGTQDCGSAIIGGVTPPEGVRKINNQAVGQGGSIGIIIFASRMLNFFSIVAGIIIMFNVLFAGFTYITSAGDASAYQKIIDKVTWSIIGMVAIISAYAIAGIVGQVFFGDPTFILQPTLEGAI